MNYPKNLLRIHLHGWRANAIRWPEDRQRIAIRRILGLVDIMEAAKGGRMKPIHFDDDLISDSAESRGSANRRAEGYFARLADVAGFDHRPLYRADETIADGLGHPPRTHIEKSRTA